MVLNKM